MVLLQAATETGVNIPGWALGLISLGVVLAIIPWGSWVTYTIFTIKSDIVLSNNTDKTTSEKLTTLSNTIDQNHEETKREMKELHSMIYKLMMSEFRRIKGRSHDDDTEKEE